MSADRPGIAYLLQVFPKYSETFIVNELLEHQRRGAPVRVLSLRLPREGRFHGCVADLGQAAEYLPESMWDQPGKLAEALRAAWRETPRGCIRAVAQRFKGRVTPRDLWQAAMVRRWAIRRGVAHLHCHFGGFAVTVAWLSRLMGGPSYSVTLHAHEIFRATANRDLLRTIVNDSAFSVTVSRFNAAHLREHIGVTPSKVRVLYNGIPLERFPLSHAAREPGTILAVGRLIEKKGFIHLVRACRTLANRGLLTRCDIVGEGREKDPLVREIKRLDLAEKVRLVGACSQERVAQALSQAAVFALPCIMAHDGNMDALPTVLLEAMAAGCPVVSTHLSGIPEMIADGESGTLVPSGDDAALAEAIAHMLRNPAAARQCAMAARRRVEDIFDVRNSVATLADWLHAAAQRGASPSDKAVENRPPAAAPAAQSVGESIA